MAKFERDHPIQGRQMQVGFYQPQTDCCRFLISHSHVENFYVETLGQSFRVMYPYLFGIPYGNIGRRKPVCNKQLNLCSDQYRRVTDRQTDRHTDTRRQLIPALAQRGADRNDYYRQCDLCSVTKFTQFNCAGLCHIMCLKIAHMNHNNKINQTVATTCGRRSCAISTEQESFVNLPLNMPRVSMSTLARSPFSLVTPYWLIAWICCTTHDVQFVIGWNGVDSIHSFISVIIDMFKLKVA